MKKRYVNVNALPDTPHNLCGGVIAAIEMVATTYRFRLHHPTKYGDVAVLRLYTTNGFPYF